MPLPSIDGLASLDPVDCACLRERLGAAGYDTAFLAGAESVAPRMLDLLRRPLLGWWLARHPGPAADLAALFSYGLPVGTARIEAALGEELAGRLRAAGVLAPGGDGELRSAFVLVPFEGQWFLSDCLDAGSEAVMGPGMTTVLLHRLLPEVLGATVLDLGCGAASLALDAARRGARAVATDISGRSLAIARFNARLNDLALETRQGDVEQPVRDERFDLVLAQPPYVPMPEGMEASTYLHGGSHGDELAMRFVAGCARVLAPGGVALLHFDSAVRPGDPLQERLRAAVGDAPAELFALVGAGPAPDQQAIFYAGADHPLLDAGYERAAVASREHLERLGVREISRVLVVLRRPRGDETPGGRYRIALTAPPVGQLRSGVVREALDALDLASSDDAAIRAARVAPPPDATFAGEWRSPSDESPTRLRVTFAPGWLAQDRELGDRGWLLFGLLDGSRSVGEAIGSFAKSCGIGPAEATGEVLAFVREGLARGLLVVARGAAAR